MKKEYVHIYLDPVVDGLLTIIKDYTGKPKTRIVSDAIIFFAYEEALQQDEEGRFMILEGADRASDYLNRSIKLAKKAQRKSGLEYGSKNLRRYILTSNHKRRQTKKIINKTENELNKLKESNKQKGE